MAENKDKKTEAREKLASTANGAFPSLKGVAATGVLSTKFESTLFKILGGIKELLLTTSDKDNLGQIEKEQENKLFRNTILDHLAAIREGAGGGTKTSDDEDGGGGGLMSMMSGAMAGVTSFIPNILKGLVPKGAPSWIKGLGGVASLAAGLIWMAVDGIAGYGKAELWNKSKTASAMAGAVAGTDSGMKGAFKNAGKWALIGAGIGTFFPVVGTLIGGLIGGAIGAVIGWIGGEKVAGFFDKVGEFFTPEKLVSLGEFLGTLPGIIGDALVKGLGYLFVGAKSIMGWLGDNVFNMENFALLGTWLGVLAGLWVKGVIGYFKLLFGLGGGIWNWLVDNIFNGAKFLEHLSAIGTMATDIFDWLVQKVSMFVGGILKGLGLDIDLDLLGKELENFNIVDKVMKLASSVTEFFYKSVDWVLKLLGKDERSKRKKRLEQLKKEGELTEGTAKESILMIQADKAERQKEWDEKHGLTKNDEGWENVGYTSKETKAKAELEGIQGALETKRKAKEEADAKTARLDATLQLQQQRDNQIRPRTGGGVNKMETSPPAVTVVPVAMPAPAGGSSGGGGDIIMTPYVRPNEAAWTRQQDRNFAL